MLPLTSPRNASIRIVTGRALPLPQPSRRLTVGQRSAAGRPSVEPREAWVIAGDEVEWRVRVERVEERLRARDLEPVRRQVFADTGPEGGRAHLLPRVVEEVAALDVDVFVVAG